MRKEVDSAAAVGLCCMHSASVRCLLGFLYKFMAAAALCNRAGHIFILSFVLIFPFLA